MTLQTYKAKRNFRKTPEPAGKEQSHKGAPIFVVQEHHASHLHYDFRLEADGVLKSWAVPKGPSMSPGDKRLAVHVEDHPLAYARFKGTIPEGQYGAGNVEIWDHGTYENLRADKPYSQSISQGIENGELSFALHGKKLKGRFALVRISRGGKGKDNWLLIKKKDEFAGTVNRDAQRSARAHPVKAPKPARNGKQQQGKPPAIDELQFSHLDKAMYPDEGITKADVILYYGKIAKYLLPHLKDRPATLERFPNGIGAGGKQHFWQKNLPDYVPDWVPRINVPTDEGKSVNYVLVNNVQTLLYLVNLGTLTFHVWMSRVEDLDRPDYVLFDLDPGNASFADVVAIARKLHQALRHLGLEGFVKTSGKSGLHIFVPWTLQGGHDEARAWATSIAQAVVKVMPDVATLERFKAARKDRVYVDTMQNGRGRHVVPPYVLRPIPGATVSTPLRWNELTARLDPKKFTMKSILARLARQKGDLMGALEKAKT